MGWAGLRKISVEIKESMWFVIIAETSPTTSRVDCDYNLHEECIGSVA